MNFADLFVVLAVVSGLYGLIVALARQKNFLGQAVNPYRRSWLVAGATMIWVGIGLYRLEARSWDLAEWRPIFSALVTDKPMTVQAKMATVAIFGGLLFLLLLLWCVISLPRDPITFRRPEDRKKAFKYYISQLKIGLDYAVLMRNDGEILEEAWCTSEINRRLEFLPRLVMTEGGDKSIRTLNDQLIFWRETAAMIHRKMGLLDEVVALAKQGSNLRMVFDIEYGGMFFSYLSLPDARTVNPDKFYLFGATLCQDQMNTKTADQHFAMLMQSLRKIDDNIRGS
jgi:hypothetical protein